MSLPSEFIDSTQQLLGEEAWADFEASLTQRPPVSIRVNEAKVAKHNLALTLDESDPVAWCRTGYYLPERLTFTFDPLFHAGAYYVQEASSMFIEQAIKQNLPDSQGVTALDLCAAPGGKTTLLRSLLPPNSLLVANEIVTKRAFVLSENLLKWGHSDLIVTSNKSEEFSKLHSMFDVILADVPCSGEGMFRKDEVAVQEWSLKNVEICWQRQREIIQNIWSTLKPGGLLIYSTCTYNTKENEENVRWITQEFEAETLAIELDTAWKVIPSFDDSIEAYRFMPHQTRGEGFFVSVIRKPGNSSSSKPLEVKERKKKKKENLKDAGLSKFGDTSNWTLATKAYQPIVFKDTLCLFPLAWLAQLELIEKSKLHIIHLGLPLAYLKGHAVVPHHALSSSNLLNPSAFERVEVSYETAISYLRKEAITLPVTTSKGYVLLTYRNAPLGFVKNIGNRSNNLYPSEWRIRSPHLPAQISTL